MTTNPDTTRVLRALCHWADQHPHHPGMSELALIAHTQLGTNRTWAALKRLQQDGVIHPHIDPRNPAIRRWRPVR